MSAPVTLEESKQILTLALAALRQKSNQAELEEIFSECSKIEDTFEQMTFKFQKMMPKVQEMLSTAFNGRQLMPTVMQIQAFSSKDPEVAMKVSKIMQVIGGDLSVLEQPEEEIEEVE
jgi:esterase/lipase